MEARIEQAPQRRRITGSSADDRGDDDAKTEAGRDTPKRHQSMTLQNRRRFCSVHETNDLLLLGASALYQMSLPSGGSATPNAFVVGDDADVNTEYVAGIGPLA